jgi:hypothetical protein
MISSGNTGSNEEKARNQEEAFVHIYPHLEAQHGEAHKLRQPTDG